jgi:phage shock protein E
MKRRVVASLVVLIAGVLVLSGCSSKPGAITNMNVKDFAAKTQQAGVVVLDVRTPGEFSQGHIQGAMNIDVEASTFDSEIVKLDKTKTYAVYCHSGNRSGVATQAMAKAGFTHLFNLQNGITDWMSQGMPTVMS